MLKSRVLAEKGAIWLEGKLNKTFEEFEREGMEVRNVQFFPTVNDEGLVIFAALVIAAPIGDEE